MYFKHILILINISIEQRFLIISFLKIKYDNLGAIWAYVTYLVVHDDVYQILGMLTPWIFVFGYLKLLPNWGYTATVAAFTPLVINLGRLPHANTAPAANYALTRIQESFIGITIAAVLTLVIFPIFAIDLLKDNIHSKLCVWNI